jgi:hypothetical protein
MHNAGYVIDDENRPISEADVCVEESSHVVKVTASGAYWRLLPPGDHTVTVSAPGYLPTTKLVHITDKHSAPIMFRLTRDETVMGLPRMVFIMLAGEYRVNKVLPCSFFKMDFFCCSCCCLLLPSSYICFHFRQHCWW